MAAQRSALDKMVMQWEAAVVHGDQDTANEVHIAGDMNLVEWCNDNNFTQMVEKHCVSGAQRVCTMAYLRDSAADEGRGFDFKDPWRVTPGVPHCRPETFW